MAMSPEEYKRRLAELDEEKRIVDTVFIALLIFAACFLALGAVLLLVTV